MIFVSAGHHPQAKGASFGDFNEYDEAIIWAQLLVAMLGSDSLLVPTGKLTEKINWINQNGNKNDIAVEIHFNSAKSADGTPVGSGCETLYCPGSIAGYNLALPVQKQLASLFRPDRGVKEGWYQMNPEKGPDAFLLRTNPVAIIIEPEFIHRVDKIKNNRDDGCYVIARGLQDYLEGVHK